MKITLRVDEQVLKRARKRAEAMGTTLSELLRTYLEEIAAPLDHERENEALKALSGKRDTQIRLSDPDEFDERR